MKTQVLVPAYGRDYTSLVVLKKDWKSGLDFQMQPQGCYCSIRDVEQLKRNGVTHLEMRYNGLRKLCIMAI